MRLLSSTELNCIVGAVCLYPKPKSTNQFYVELNGSDAFTWGIGDDLILRFEQHGVFAFAESDGFVPMYLTSSNWTQYGIQRIEEHDMTFLISFIK